MSSIVSNRRLSESCGSQLDSLAEPTGTTHGLGLPLRLCHVIRWPLWLTFQPFTVSENCMQRDTRSAGTGKTCPNHLNWFTFIVSPKDRDRTSEPSTLRLVFDLLTKLLHRSTGTAKTTVAIHWVFAYLLLLVTLFWSPIAVATSLLFMTRFMRVCVGKGVCLVATSAQYTVKRGPTTLTLRRKMAQNHIGSH